jgi:1-deoxy-D-xylulose-5-phosphate reductoisomerase
VAAGRAGGTSPTAFNAANEVAVAAFLAGSIPLGRIAETVERVLESHRPEPARDIDTVRAADSWARAEARKALA